jgi:hypothetical protein
MTQPNSNLVWRLNSMFLRTGLRSQSYDFQIYNHNASAVVGKNVIIKYYKNMFFITTRYVYYLLRCKNLQRHG